MRSDNEDLSSNIPSKEEKSKPSLVEKIVDSIHKDIVEVIETIRETEKS
jgi:hypothetical protein